MDSKFERFGPFGRISNENPHRRDLDSNFPGIGLDERIGERYLMEFKLMNQFFDEDVVSKISSIPIGA